MGIAEDLKTLQDLHEKGQLTDAEYSTAKATALAKQSNSSQPAGAKSLIGRGTMALIAIALLFVGFTWYKQGGKATGQMLAAAVHAPIELTNEVQNLPANSWKAIPFTTAYAGSVTIKIRVLHGNPLDVLVTNLDQLNVMKSGAWQSVLSYTDFAAQKTQVYQRTSSLPQGTCYLVLRDTSLGILSSSATDVSIDIQLKP